MRKLTEASGLKSKSRYTNIASYQVPPSRQGSRLGERPPPSRGGMLPPPSRTGEKPPSRNGEIPPSRNGEKPPSRLGESRQGGRPSVLRTELPLQHIAADTDSDLTVSIIQKLCAKVMVNVNQSDASLYNQCNIVLKWIYWVYDLYVTLRVHKGVIKYR